MRIAITGGSGFLGSHIVESAVSAGHEVRALVRPTSDRRALDPLEVEVAEGDVTDPASLDAVCADAEIVIHSAAQIGGFDEIWFSRVNVLGSRLVAEASVRAGARRLIVVSSITARGPTGAGGPVSGYGRSKLKGEQAIRRAVGGAIELVFVRPTNVYGPRCKDKLPLFHWMQAGIRVVYADAVTSFIHAADVGDAVLGLSSAPVEAVADRVFEAGDGDCYPMREAMGLIAEAVGSPGPVGRVPDFVGDLAAVQADLIAVATGEPPVFGTDRLADNRGEWRVDPAPMWEAVGHGPRYDLKAGLKDTVAWYRQAGWLR